MEASGSNAKAGWNAAYSAALQEARVNYPDDPVAQHRAAERAASRVLRMNPGAAVSAQRCAAAPPEKLSPDKTASNGLPVQAGRHPGMRASSAQIGAEIVAVYANKTGAFQGPIQAAASGNALDLLVRMVR